MTGDRKVFGSALLHVPHPHRRTADPAAEARSAAVNPTAVLVTSCAVLFVIAVNTTAVNAALNGIADDLSLRSGELSWIVGVYMLAVAAFVVLGGRLGDQLGERRMVVAGLAIFGVGAAFVAAADAAWVAILGRFVQGSGAAILMPASMAILRLAYPPERQGFALGIWGAVGGAGFGVGPLIGGALTDLLSWRWVWLLTLVAALALGALALTALRGMPRPREHPRFDPAGIVLLPISLFALILAIQQGPQWGWGSAGTITAYVLSAIGFVALAVTELRVEWPLLHLDLLRIRGLIAANLGTFVNAIFLIGMLYFFNLYAQSVVTLDYSAVLASVALLPYGACVFAASLASGRVCDRVGFRWPIAAGLALMGLGGLLLGRIDAASGYGDIWWASIVLGLGVGITFSTPGAAGLRAVSGDRAGEASGIINSLRYVAAALVIALGTVAFNSVGSDDLNASLDRAAVPHVEDERLDKTLTGAPEQVEAIERTLPPRAREAYRGGAETGVASGYAAVMLGLGLFALAAALIWIVLMRPTRGP